MQRMHKKLGMITTILTGAVLLPASAVSVETTALPGVIDKKVPEVNIPKKFDPATKEAAPAKEAPVLEDASKEEVVATFSTINVTGAKQFSAEEISLITAEYTGRPLTKFDLAELKYKLTRKFYDAGYILVRVVTPPQNLTDGVLDINVYEAKVGAVTVLNEGVLNKHVASAITGRVEENRVFDENSIESMVSDINNLKNIRASVNLQPGKEFVTTDVTLAIEEDFEDEQRVSIDNYGSPLTGEVVATAHFEKSNLLNLGETIYTDMRRSDGDLWSIAAGINTPIAVSNLRLETSFLHSENDIDDRLSALGLSGTTDSLNVALASDILNTRNRKLTVRGGFQGRDHKSVSDATGVDFTTSKDEIRKVFAEFESLQRIDGGVVYASARVSTGIDAFGATNQGDALASNVFGDPDAWIVQPMIYSNLLSPFSSGNFILTASGQISTSELLSSELFTLGGYGSVRGFEPAELTGESGIQFSVEYQHPVEVHDDVDFFVAPFMDGGRVYNRRNNGRNEYADMYSVGLGLEARTDIIEAGTTVLRLDWAHTLGNYSIDQDTNGDGVVDTYAKDPTVNSDYVYFRISQKF